ncbi:MAG: methyltransferase domain-containing protein [Candidatus Latescibacteria bacterium]|nr:methyltransferase domain-containing protein [Candidatus Latescibacterota bacterium]
MKNPRHNRAQSHQSPKTEYFSELGSDWDNIVGNDDERNRQLASVLEMIEPSEGDVVVDAGCGNGVLIPLIEPYIGSSGRIIAVDAAEGMIKTAEEKHGHFGNIDFRMGRIEDIDIPEDHADLMLCFAVFPHIDDQQAALRRFHQILKPDGELYIFHVIDTRSLNEFHGGLDAPVSGDRMPEREELNRMLKSSSFAMKTYIDRTGLNFVRALPI